MSEEALYALFLMALLLCAYYYTSGSQEPQSHQSSRKEQQISEDTLSVSASRLRNSLGIKRSKLQSNTVVSVSISLDDIILKRSEGSDSLSLSSYVILDKDEVVKILTLLCEFANIFFIAMVSTDEEEVLIKKLVESELKDVTSSLPFPLLSHRLLFCSTTIGKTAIVRQLLPDVHIDADKALCEAMFPFISSLIHVNIIDHDTSVHPPPQKATSWRVINSLKQLLPTV